jgi:hypothetical protein
MATRMDMETGRVDRGTRGDVWPWVLLAIAVIAAVIWWASTMANNNPTTTTPGMGGVNNYDTGPVAPGTTTGGPVPGTGGVR